MSHEPVSPMSAEVDVRARIDRSILVRELTLGEFRRWIVEASRDRDPVIANLCDGFDALDLISFSDLKAEEVDRLLADDVRRIAAAVREVNKAYFDMLERLAPGDPQ